MAVLMVGLMVPLMMILGLVSERAGRRHLVTQEVSEQWGGAQTILGPALSIEFRRATLGVDGKPKVETDRAVFLPAALQVTAEAVPEVRSRGLFEVIVYRSRLTLTGRFAVPDFSRWRVPPEDVLLSTATVSVGLTEPRGIAAPLAMRWDGKDHRFVPGTPDLSLGMPGISATVPLTDPAREIPFEITIAVNGTRDLRFTPAGNETVVNLSSPWPHPGFTGAPLPQERSITDAGFTATWNVPYYGRSFPSSWSVNTIAREPLAASIAQASFGVSLVQPVDIYQQSERAVKYAALFIVMTFVIAFLWEIIHGVLVHPVQYLFVGFALCVFYLLLLALSEHIGFDAAYLTAALANIALIAWYWTWVIRSGVRHGLLMGVVLSALYSYLYLLLRLEDYSLLAGAIGLFLMLAAVMFLTRRIDWYTLRLGREPAEDGIR
jgi:inner membrane protein